jgi:hypothetical protein
MDYEIRDSVGINNYNKIVEHGQKSRIRQAGQAK